MKTRQTEWSVLLLHLMIVFSLFFIGEGKYLVAAQDKEGKENHTQLMIMDADGSNLKVLFQSDEYPTLGSPEISSDGKKIAMDGSKKIRGNANNSRILIINFDGSDLLDVVDGAMPTWSSDGKKMTFTRERPYGVWMMDANGTNLEHLDSRGRGAQWSPDGTMILFVDQSMRARNLKIYHTKEDTFRYVFPFSKGRYNHFFSNCCWSPDNKSICAKATTKDNKQQIVTVDLNKGIKGIKVHYSNPEIKSNADFSWHPDGNKILCVLQTPESKTSKIYSFNPLKEGQLKMIPGQNSKEIPEDLCWTPDGKKIIFTRR